MIEQKHSLRLGALLLLPLVLLVLSACGGPASGGSSGDDGTGTPITPAKVDITGRLVVPQDLLGEDLEYESVFAGTRIWLLADGDEPITAAAPDEIGAFSFTEVTAGKSAYRLLAIIGSGPDAVTMEANIGKPSGEEGTIYANITAESTIGAEVARDPELAARYEAKIEEALLAAYDEGVEPLTTADLNPGDFALVGFDDSSLADGLPSDAAAAELSTMATGVKRIQRCEWQGMLWWREEVCNDTLIRIPDLVVQVPDPLSSTLAPRLKPFTLPGTEIAKRVTADERRVAMRIDANGQLQFFSNGIISTGGLNIIATGGLNIIAAGGGNIIAAGGGNIISAGGGNIIAAGGGNVLAPGQAALFEPQGGRYAGSFALVSADLVSRVDDNARLAQFAAGQINAQQLMSNISANIIAAGGGNARRIMSVGEPITEPGDVKTVVAEPAPAYTQEQIDAMIQAFSPPRIHKVAATRQSNGLELDLAPGGKALVQASYVEPAEMVAVWSGNWTGYELVEFEPHGTASGNYVVPIPSQIPTADARLAIVKLPASGRPGEAVRFSNEETVVFDAPGSFTTALLLDGETVVAASRNTYYHSVDLGYSSAGHLYHQGNRVEEAELLFRFDNRSMPVTVESPDGVLSSFEVSSASLAPFADPEGGHPYYRLPLQKAVLGAGSTPYIRFGSTRQHDRHLYVYMRKVSIAPSLEVVEVEGFDAAGYPRVRVRIDAGTESFCDPILGFFEEPHQTNGGRGKTYGGVCVEPGEQLETVLTFDQEPTLAPGVYYVALYGWYGNELTYSNYRELQIDGPADGNDGSGAEGLSIAGLIPAWGGAHAQVEALAVHQESSEFERTLIASAAVAGDGSFVLELPGTVPDEALSPVEYAESGCSNGIVVAPGAARWTAVYGLDVTADAEQIGFTYLASRPLEEHDNTRIGDKTLVAWVYVDREVTIDGSRSCTHDGTEHSLSARNLTLYRGWNPITTEVTSTAPGYAEELSGDLTGTDWHWFDFSGF